jgi:integrase
MSISATNRYRNAWLARLPARPRDVDDKTIQAILRHSNVSLTQNIYIKSVMESQVSAMDSLSEKLGICNAGERPSELRMHTS